MKNKKIILFFLSITLIAGLSYFVIVRNSREKIVENTIKFLPQTSNEAGISFEVKLLDLKELVKFEITIDTHADSLDFDLIKISLLEDDEGNKYLPLEWQGAGPGGHHREGILSFPKLKNKPKSITEALAGVEKNENSSIKLIIKDIPGERPRIFEWNF